MDPRCRVTEKNGSLAVAFPYNAGMVASLKAQIPPQDRSWDSSAKVWLVSSTYGGVLVALYTQYFGGAVHIPTIQTGAKSEMRLLEVHYIGTCKTRAGWDASAFGWDGTKWAFIFPETVLREWFEGEQVAPDQAQTLYSILGVSRQANADEIKTGYRRMVRLWHPDVCREPNAANVFMRIQEAYQILSIQKTRGRYDAGLALEASLHVEAYTQTNWIKNLNDIGYRSPLRSGWIMAVGVEKMSRFVIEKISAWEDITREGKTLVASWKMGADAPMEEWV